MEKWKIVVIAALLASPGLYSYLQTREEKAAIAALSRKQAEAQAEAEAAEPLQDETLPVFALRGKPAPKWNVPANLWVNTSQPLTPQNTKGSVTLIEFWRMGCSHCRDAAPFLSKLYRDYTPRGLKMVSFQSPPDGAEFGSPEANWNEVKTFIKREKLTYPVGFDADGSLFQDTYKGTNYPTFLVVDKQGVVRFVQTGYQEDTARGKRKIKALLAAIDAELKK